MARFTFKLPDIGEGISEAEIVAWHVKVGDRIEEDQQIADMMTDKATVEMESPVSGIVIELAGEVGDQVSIGAALVVIETEGDFSAAEAPALEPVTDTVNIAPASAEQVEVAEQYEAENPGVEAASPSPLRGEGRGEGTSATGGAPSVPAQPLSPTLSPEGEREKVVLASPAVRARAADLGIDLAQVKTEGDRVRHADLDAFLRYGQGQGYHAPHVSHARADEAIKVIGMRRRIAENMAASKRAIPHFTYVEEIDVTALEAMRADLNGARGSRPKLTMLPLLIAAICKTVPAFPMINARYDDEAGVVTRHGAVHLGMATQTDAGLTVPVIRDAQDRNVWQLAAEILRLAEAARANKLKPDEMGGGTLTVTSLGPLGGIATTPVINRPEVAIIGPNKIVERPVFVGDEIVRAKLMNLSISCDHRVVDGWDAASFVQALKRYLETPVLLFAD
ncbi:2-oxoisovalerate dehydrogenase E2 component (dihydrolipoyl transacylase) [Sphingomonas sp. BE270]|jgi:2-oxoisovalerate dehydrogenase E2 component (dihydrolipoyl transacylase)|uniref:dihydrolipoamide acetyltransferase family protein n=2 Tax=Sphingomonas TaxID=13687 RepID=UPI0010F9FDED|nr:MULTISPECIES: dihydrolipoamide acetyltransferase family protein [unclassified Sphingomonas]MDR6848734.1 2-oxoisovalerate dehydrogenase E2 component (dihydrolipoyl transacylase) [Sphingomonas sp. BE137]MDR7256017.1 2-oxoisovalerate dehydrogenase E2 component (dihydrolipoyl transacylase) [Sphingomonas sp. BE270]